MKAKQEGGKRASTHITWMSKTSRFSHKYSHGSCATIFSHCYSSALNMWGGVQLNQPKSRERRLQRRQERERTRPVSETTEHNLHFQSCQ